MRLWTIHPRYLDTRGLNALWNETLLAIKVLTRRTEGAKNNRGWIHHPQLDRFRQGGAPLLRKYARAVYYEAFTRRFNYDGRKLRGTTTDMFTLVNTTEEQVLYEFRLLKEKLKLRDPDRIRNLPKEPINWKDPAQVWVNPTFNVVPGPVELWETVQKIA